MKEKKEDEKELKFKELKNRSLRLQYEDAKTDLRRAKTKRDKAYAIYHEQGWVKTNTPRKKTAKKKYDLAWKEYKKAYENFRKIKKFYNC